jgi:serine phosphatase RsbU (regulator of sigma subunit)
VSHQNPGPTYTVSLLTGEHAEEAQASYWRPISWKWPEFAPAPALEVLDWRAVAEGTITPGGSVVLVMPPDDADSADLFRLLDRLADAGLPVVALSQGESSPLARATGEGLIVVPAGTDHSLVAGMIHALATRQECVDLLRTEVNIARRSQGGLRGEIEKIHEELELAASVQREFLPRTLPPAANIDIQILFRPCGYVSGDIYDVQQVSDHEIGFFIADAVGHGVPAALMTMVLCRCLTTHVIEDGVRRALPPSRVMQQLNEDLIRRHGDSARFATAVYGVIDTRSRRVSVSGAGHPYPLVIRPDGSAERMETTGGMLGLFPDDLFDEASVQLGRGDMLVLYSDGFETAFPAAGADNFGRKKPNTNYVERFAHLAETWRTHGLTAAIRQMCDHIDRQSGSLHQRDDLTAMMIVPVAENDLDRLFRGEKGIEHPPEPMPGPAAPLG